MNQFATVQTTENESQAETDREYLTFHLAAEEYGIDILRVRELRGWEPVTRIPNSPEYVMGVLNLRGAIVPVIDLRIRFDLPRTDYTPTTVVVVLSIRSGDGRERVMGVVVDAISDVVNASLSDIQTTPEFDSSIKIEYIMGLASAGDKMLMLVDVDKLLEISEIA
jgi:purine-binding chemotaxis protein CheW